MAIDWSDLSKLRSQHGLEVVFAMADPAFAENDARHMLVILKNEHGNLFSKRTSYYGTAETGNGWNVIPRPVRTNKIRLCRPEFERIHQGGASDMFNTSLNWFTKAYWDSQSSKYGASTYGPLEYRDFEVPE